MAIARIMSAQTEDQWEPVVLHAAKVDAVRGNEFDIARGAEAGKGVEWYTFCSRKKK